MLTYFRLVEKSEGGLNAIIKQLAEELKMEKNTAKVNVYRARIALKKYLNQHDP